MCKLQKQSLLRLQQQQFDKIIKNYTKNNDRRKEQEQEKPCQNADQCKFFPCLN